jgi:hypothetical protein
VFHTEYRTTSRTLELRPTNNRHTALTEEDNNKPTDRMSEVREESPCRLRDYFDIDKILKK